MSDTVMPASDRTAQERPAVDRVADLVADFSASLDLSEWTGWKLIREGKIKPIKIGKRTLVPRSERDRFLASLQAAS